MTMYKCALHNLTILRNYRYIKTVGTLHALATLVPLPYHQVDIMKEIKWAGNIARMMDKKIHVEFDGEKF